MSGITVLNVSQCKLVYKNELALGAFQSCYRAIHRLIQCGQRPVVVVLAPLGDSRCRTVASASAIIGQTKMMAQWVAGLSALGITCAQLMIESHQEHSAKQLAQMTATIKTLAALDVVPVITLNELVWKKGRANSRGADIPSWLPPALGALVVEPLLEYSLSKQVNEITRIKSWNL